MWGEGGGRGGNYRVSNSQWKPIVLAAPGPSTINIDGLHDGLQFQVYWYSLLRVGYSRLIITQLQKWSHQFGILGKWRPH